MNLFIFIGGMIGGYLRRGFFCVWVRLFMLRCAAAESVEPCVCNRHLFRALEND